MERAIGACRKKNTTSNIGQVGRFRRAYPHPNQHGWPRSLLDGQHLHQTAVAECEIRGVYLKAYDGGSRAERSRPSTSVSTTRLESTRILIGRHPIRFASLSYRLHRRCDVRSLTAVDCPTVQGIGSTTVNLINAAYTTFDYISSTV